MVVARKAKDATETENQRGSNPSSCQWLGAEGQVHLEKGLQEALSHLDDRFQHWSLNTTARSKSSCMGNIDIAGPLMRTVAYQDAEIFKIGGVLVRLGTTVA